MEFSFRVLPDGRLMKQGTSYHQPVPESLLTCTRVGKRGLPNSPPPETRHELRQSLVRTCAAACFTVQGSAVQGSARTRARLETPPQTGAERERFAQ